MNFKLLPQNVIMNAKGFKKLYLQDTKGVLTSKNNHKWVKVKAEDPQGIHIKRTEVLPSGTTVEYKGELTDVFKNSKPTADYVTISKTVSKPDGRKIVTTKEGIFELCSNGVKDLRDGSKRDVLFI